VSPASAAGNVRSLRELVKHGAGTVNCLMFRNGAEVFAIPLDRISEAMDSVPLLELPDMGAGTIGMIGVAGTTVPVLDGREFLGVATSERNPSVLMFSPLPDSTAHSGVAGPVLALAVDELLSSAEFDLNLVRRVIAFEDPGGIFAGVIIRDGGVITLLDSDTFVRMSAVSYTKSTEMR
jgi:chemotaxis signal transduction protein